MKRVSLKQIIFPVIFFAALSLGACRSRTATDPEAPPPASPSAPDTAVATNSTTALQISSTDSLQPRVDSIVKTYPDVKASIDSGVVTLKGKIARDQLPKLMTSLHELHPKNIRNNLELK